MLLSLFYRLFHHNPSKQISILPTWQHYLATREGPTEGYVYSINLKGSPYFAFYNGLINDKRLLSKMHKYSYTGILGMHPNFVKNWVDFTENEVFKVCNCYVDYQKVFVTSSLLIIDYSCVAFDFALLKKPVLYTQFDRDTFFQYHTYRQGFLYMRTMDFVLSAMILILLVM